MRMGRGIEKFCPVCGEDITDSYDEETKDYYCDACELPIVKDD